MSGANCIKFTGSRPQKPKIFDVVFFYCIISLTHSETCFQVSLSFKVARKRDNSFSSGEHCFTIQFFVITLFMIKLEKYLIILQTVFFGHILLLCPQLVVKTKYIDPLIKLLLALLLLTLLFETFHNLMDIVTLYRACVAHGNDYHLTKMKDPSKILLICLKRGVTWLLGDCSHLIIHTLCCY